MLESQARCHAGSDSQLGQDGQDGGRAAEDGEDDGEDGEDGPAQTVGCLTTATVTLTPGPYWTKLD